MFPILQVGPLAVQTGGLILLAGLWLGLTLAERFAPQRRLSPSQLYNLFFAALLAGLIGGRLAYALRFPAAFAHNPLSLISLNPGLFNTVDGLIVAGLLAWIYASRKKMPLWATLDALTPALMVILIAIGLSHVATGTAFGKETSAPWGIELWGAVRHPSQIYETLAASLILFLLWPQRNQVAEWPNGVYFLAFMGLSAGSRLILEAFRGDSLLLPGGFRSTQLIAWLILAACLYGIYRLKKDRRNQDLDQIETYRA
jgi:phosphatidylglycerol:prolipoprotein diacylglycerol transferase